jgi:repressor LexA
MSIGKNIRKLREKHNLTQKELAEISGVTDKAVSMWEQDERIPRMGALQKISEKLGVKISSILESGSSYLSDTNSVLIPVFNIGEFIKSKVALPQNSEFIATDLKELIPGEKYFYCFASDDRMSPLINKKDTLLVHQKNYINSGACCLISIDGESPIISKIMYFGDRVELEFENFNYENMVFSSGEFKRLKIVGEIKKLIRKF